MSVIASRSLTSDGTKYRFSGRLKLAKYRLKRPRWARVLAWSQFVNISERWCFASPEYNPVLVPFLVLDLVLLDFWSRRVVIREKNPNIRRTYVAIITLKFKKRLKVSAFIYRHLQLLTDSSSSRRRNFSGSQVGSIFNVFARWPQRLWFRRREFEGIGSV